MREFEEQPNPTKDMRDLETESQDFQNADYIHEGAEGNHPPSADSALKSDMAGKTSAVLEKAVANDADSPSNAQFSEMATQQAPDVAEHLENLPSSYYYYKSQAEKYHNIANENNSRANKLENDIRSGKIPKNQVYQAQREADKCRATAKQARNEVMKYQKAMADALRPSPYGYSYAMEDSLNQATLENASQSVCRSSRTPQYLW